MLTLSLLRHAKSGWDNPDLDDHERALAPRGTKAAREIGKYLTREKLRPGLILCSGAVRTRATLALILPELGATGIDIRYDDSLYLAHPAILLEIVRRVPKGASHVLLVGHNPGLHALALELTGEGDKKLIADLATKFPTGALAVLSFETNDWKDIKPGAGRLDRFVSPRDLKD